MGASKAEWTQTRFSWWLEMETFECAVTRRIGSETYDLYTDAFENRKYISVHDTLAAAKRAGEQLAREHFKALLDAVPETPEKGESNE